MTMTWQKKMFPRIPWLWDIIPKRYHYFFPGLIMLCYHICFINWHKQPIVDSLISFVIYPEFMIINTASSSPQSTMKHSKLLINRIVLIILVFFMFSSSSSFILSPLYERSVFARYRLKYLPRYDDKVEIIHNWRYLRECLQRRADTWGQRHIMRLKFLIIFKINY